MNAWCGETASLHEKWLFCLFRRMQKKGSIYLPFGMVTTRGVNNSHKIILGSADVCARRFVSFVSSCVVVVVVDWPSHWPSVYIINLDNLVLYVQAVWNGARSSIDFLFFFFLFFFVRLRSWHFLALSLSHQLLLGRRRCCDCYSRFHHQWRLGGGNDQLHTTPWI